MSAPTLSDLQALADQAVGHIEGEGQVLLVWERTGDHETARAMFTVVRDGRAGEAATTDLDDLRRTAHRAWLLAGQPRATPAPPLPEPAPGAAHDGFDARALDAVPHSEHRDGLSIDTTATASRIAVASTAGVRAAEERSSFTSTVRAGTAVLSRTAVGPADAPLDEARVLLDATALGHAGDGPVVLGPDAVAFVLNAVRPAFGVDAALGAPPPAPVAEAISLTDASLHIATLPRSFDAEGVPRRPVTLIDRGVPRHPVTDSAAAAKSGEPSTGHASRPLMLAPSSEHLVLAGGDAEDLDALVATATTGLYVPVMGRDPEGQPVMLGARAIERGRLAGGVPDALLAFDAHRVLVTARELTAPRWLIPLRGHCPGGGGAALVPALLATAGVEPLR